MWIGSNDRDGESYVGWSNGTRDCVGINIVDGKSRVQDCNRTQNFVCNFKGTLSMHNTGYISAL